MFEQHDDAIDLLKRDHRAVERLFAEFGKATQSSKRIQLAQRICSELAIHAKVEEELFYPAARDALGHDEAALVFEANVEHDTLKQLIGRMDGSHADAIFDARMQVLQEYVQHHVREEEMRLMPAARRSVVNLDSLGDSIARRKQALTQQAQSDLATRAQSGRVHIPGIERKVAAANTPAHAEGASRNTASRKAKTTSRTRNQPAKRLAAGKRKSNRGSQRRSVARRGV